MKTTLNKIREQSPCQLGLEELLRTLGKTKADDELISIETILNSNALDYTLCCLGAVEGRDREIRHYMVWCARQVQHLMTDQRSINALDVAEKFADGLATQAELSAARDAAWDAARDSSSEAARAAARSAAWSVAWSAARSAARAASADARDAVRAAARSAAWSVAWYVAWGVARDAAWDAASAAQEKKLRELCAWCDQNPVLAGIGETK